MERTFKKNMLNQPKDDEREISRIDTLEIFSQQPALYGLIE